jgi:hypothetical protein
LGTKSAYASTYYTDEYGDTVKETVTYDSDGIESVEVEKELQVVPLGAPFWVASSKVARTYEFNFTMTFNGTGSSKSYTSKSKSGYKSIDKVGVFTTLTMGSTVLAQKSVSNQHASTAVATASKANVIGDGTLKDTSNHTFEHTGYQSWYPTTVAKSAW